ncbi:MAG: hypothetical protein JWN59_342 [Sphingomonas bacterium]|nr:hypothetical protein [Sphingomonas bacterium]
MAVLVANLAGEVDTKAGKPLKPMQESASLDAP